MRPEYEIPGENNKYNFPSRNIVDYDSTAIIFIYSGEDTGKGRTVYTLGGTMAVNITVIGRIRSMMHIKRRSS